MRLRFIIRDLLWLTALAAIATLLVVASMERPQRGNWPVRQVDRRLPSLEQNLAREADILADRVGRAGRKANPTIGDEDVERAMRMDAIRTSPPAR